MNTEEITKLAHVQYKCPTTSILIDRMVDFFPNIYADNA